VTLIVQPKDPEAIAATKAQRRRVRLTIIVLAVLMVLIGILLSVGVMIREMDNARMKADFAANVSHELRSPITQIRIKGESLLFGLVEEHEQQSYFESIVRESERLSRLVDNVLDFAAIERGAKKYHFKHEDLGLLIHTTIEAGRSAVESQRCEVELDVPHDLPAVWIDREAAGQVLTNLISNAAKYGQEGGWVGVRARVGLEGVDVSVSDRGMGIAKEELEHIFDKFYRSNAAAVRRRKGTGIGLAIVRYIVDAHGGTISVDSEVGKGTTFSVTFPLHSPGDAGVIG